MDVPPLEDRERLLRALLYVLVSTHGPSGVSLHRLALGNAYSEDLSVLVNFRPGSDYVEVVCTPMRFRSHRSKPSNPADDAFLRSIGIQP